jgi:hypothetical protein
MVIEEVDGSITFKQAMRKIWVQMTLTPQASGFPHHMDDRNLFLKKTWQKLCPSLRWKVRVTNYNYKPKPDMPSAKKKKDTRDADRLATGG